MKNNAIPAISAMTPASVPVLLEAEPKPLEIDLKRTALPIKKAVPLAKRVASRIQRPVAELTEYLCFIL